jgi:formylglycine-generating enzyme required for sulfatase activity
MTTEAQDYFNQLQAADIAQGQAKLRTLALEFQATLSRLPTFQAEIDTILSQGAGIDYDGLAVRMEPALTSASELLIELDTLPVAIHDAAAMREFIHMLLATLTARTVEPLTKKFHEQRVQVEQALKEEAKKKAEAEARAIAEQKAQEKAEAEARKRVQIEKETAERLKAETERQARALVEAEARKRAQLEKEETERKIKAEAERRAQEKVQTEARKREQQEKEEAERKIKADAEQRAQEAAERKKQEAAREEGLRQIRAEAEQRQQATRAWVRKYRAKILVFVAIVVSIGVFWNHKVETQREFERQAEARYAADQKTREKAREKAEAEARNPVMVKIPAGSFTMGCVPDRDKIYEYACSDHESPPHSVRISEFYMGKYEVTFAQFDRFCEATGVSKPEDEGWGRGNRPVINVSWNDAVKYADWLRDVTKKPYRLPTEAEWEYAARGGGKNAYPTGQVYQLEDANTNGIKGKTTEVGQYPANGFGLHDMQGNVWEWVSDYYGSDYYQTSPTENPQGPSTGSDRVSRGGSWKNNSWATRAAFRIRNTPDDAHDSLGFRLVLPSSASGK